MVGRRLSLEKRGWYSDWAWEVGRSSLLSYGRGWQCQSSAAHRRRGVGLQPLLVADLVVGEEGLGCPLRSLPGGYGFS